MSTENQQYKVLVVDDSLFMRRILADILESDPRLKVIGTAYNGKMAIDSIRELNPDVVTMDVEMPVMDGLETLKELRKITSVPVIMISSLTEKGSEVTIKALELGAFDFIQKPDKGSGITVEDIKQDLISKVILAAQTAVKTAFTFKKKDEEKVSTPRPTISISPSQKTDKMVMISSSTGGPQALKTVISALPKNLPAKVLIVQHMPAKFTETFAQRLDTMSELDVFEAKDGDVPEPGKVFLAPGNYHMDLDHQGIIRLNQQPAILGLRPCADITINSVSRIYRENLICVTLTGMGHDSRDGITFAKKNGALAIAEHESTCVVYGMPRSVIEAGLADVVVPLEDIPNEIVKAVVG